MRRGARLLLLLVVAAVVSHGGAVAAAPAMADVTEVVIAYQGRLTDAAGRPVTGVLEMEFRLYSSAAAGSLLWPTVQTPFSVAVSDGAFLVELRVPRNLLDGRDLWLAIYVEGDALQPRQPFRAVPLAAALVPGATVRAAGPSDALAVQNAGTGGALSGTSSRGNGVYGYSESGAGIYGVDAGSANGVGYGGYFLSASGVGVYGACTAPSDLDNPLAPGVQGRSVHGYGVHGETTAPNRAGVFGKAVTGVGLEGHSASGIGLRARSDLGTGAWVESGAGVGLEVQTQGGDASDHGLVVTAAGGAGVVASSVQSVAVRGDAGATGGLYQPSGRTGVAGLGEGRGVLGASADGVGVEGRSQANHGVYGHSVSGYGGQFVSLESAALYVRSMGDAAYDAIFDGQQGVRITGNLLVEGELVAGGGKSGYVTDVARNAGPEALLPGDLVEITGSDDAVVGEIPVPLVRRTQEAATHRVVGIVDRAFDVERSMAVATGEGGIAPGEYLTIVTHGAYCCLRADASAGAIAPGDLLVAGATPGYAERAEEPRAGTLVGKALDALAEAQGLLRVMVLLE